VTGTIPRADDGVLRDDLVIAQGSAWNRTWSITDSGGSPLDVTGWTVRAQIRPFPEWPMTLFEWTTSPNAGMGLALVSGNTVTLTLNGDSDSALWIFTSGYYDVLLRNPSNVPTRIVEGSIRVSPLITR